MNGMSGCGTINGKDFRFTPETTFLVQVGRGSKGAYKTRYSFKGDIQKALFYFESINIGRGFKKRFLIDGRTFIRHTS